jgi:hypothetical protein
LGSERACLDIEEEIRSEIGEHGECFTVMGGFEVLVKDPTRFPWARVFRTLLELGHEVWVELRGENLVIVSKAPVE